MLNNSTVPAARWSTMLVALLCGGGGGGIFLSIHSAGFRSLGPVLLIDCSSVLGRYMLECNGWIFVRE
jgi:hypothetical protein